MNSRSGVNETNLVNFPADLSSVNQVDSKDGILSFPFDHIYACHSGSAAAAERRQGLEEVSEIQITGAKDKDVDLNSNPQFIQLTEQVVSLQNQNNKLKKLVITHLDLIQQQNELITKRDKLYLKIKQENDSLRSRLSRVDKKHSSSSQRNVSNPPPLVHIPTATVSRAAAKKDTSGPSHVNKILFNSYTELLLHGDNSSKYTVYSDIKKNDHRPEIYGIANRNIEGEKRNYLSTDLGITSVLDNNPPYQSRTMIESKRKYPTKENKSENRFDSLLNTSKTVPALQKIQRNRKKSASVTSTQCKTIKNTTIIKTEPLHNSTYDDDKAFNRNYVVNKRSKMINTYSKCSRLSTPKKTTQFTGSLSDRLRLIDTTPTGEDPYQLGEADMREQSPIPKLMLQKTNHGRMKVLKTEPSVPQDSPGKVNQYHLTNPYVHPSELGKDDEFDDFKLTDGKWGITDKSNLSDICDDFADIIKNPELTMKSECFNQTAVKIEDSVESTATAVDLSGAILLKADFLESASDKKTSRKRAHSTSLLKSIKKEGMGKDGKDSKPTKPKSSKPRAGPSRVKNPPLPGLETDKPYHTLVGDPDTSWYLGLDPDVKPDDPPQQVSTVEVPRWREKPFTALYTLEGTENLTDQVFEKRHQKHEAEEKRQLRCYMRRIREQRHVERLRQRHRDSWGGSSPPRPATYTVWPRALQDVRYIEITDTLPVMAFGEALPAVPEADFKLPWVKTSRAMKRSKRSRTLQ